MGAERRIVLHEEAAAPTRLPLCDQEDETINHVLLTCVFARSTWAVICEALGKPDWTPSQEDTLAEWAVDKRGSHGMSTKDLRTIVMLAWWELWMHRNAIVFDEARPSIESLLGRVRREGQVWAQLG